MGVAAKSDLILHHLDFDRVQRGRFFSDSWVMTKSKVLIAFADINKANHLKGQLEAGGFDCLAVDDGRQACDIVKKWQAEYMLMDLMLSGHNAMEAIKELSRENLLGPTKTKVIIISSHGASANIRQFIKLGASDFLVQPFDVEELIRRLLFHARQQRELAAVNKSNGQLKGESQQDKNLFLHLTGLVLKQTARVSNEHDFLFRLTKMTSMALNAKRCSFIEARVGDYDGVVLASSDNSKLSGHGIDLRKYPEVLHCVHTHKTVVLDNLENDPTMAAVQRLLKEVQFNAIMIVPVIIDDEVIGVLSARMPKERESLTDEEIRFAQVVASCMGLGLSNLQARRALGYEGKAS